MSIVVTEAVIRQVSPFMRLRRFDSCIDKFLATEQLFRNNFVLLNLWLIKRINPQEMSEYHHLTHLELHKIRD
jgi:hypothetical protein